MLTVRGVLKRLFPMQASDASGPVSEPELPYPQWPVNGKHGLELEDDPFAIPPLLPFDVFAFCAHLLELSGAYHHVVPLPPRHYDSTARQRADKQFGTVKDNQGPGAPRTPAGRLLTISDEALEKCRAAAAAWRRPLSEGQALRGRRSSTRQLPSDDTEFLLRKRFRELADLGVLGLWKQLVQEHGDEPIYATTDPNDPPPQWWRIAHELMIVADEACANVGFSTPLELDLTSSMPWFEDIVMELFFDAQWEAWLNRNDGRPFHPQGVFTLSFADPDTVCVVPKARTTAVGCTLRSLSHHLALLPAQGIARANWLHPLPGGAPDEDREMNILLVPYPFRISDRAFHGVMGSQGSEPNWGLFEIWQHWIDDLSKTKANRAGQLAGFISDLACDATERHGARSIDMVVLPELAIDFDIFDKLCTSLKQQLPTLELFVAGLSADQSGRHGNFVGIAMYGREDAKALESDKAIFSATDDRAFQYSIREKHHKWKLDRGQLRSYGLQGALNPRLDWWEDIDLLSRRVDFTAFRHSVMAAMICEDLARVDPCQELLRSVGPNLIVALLMDAPQLENRWPARYATVLAEDPGSAVLTLTSRALMTRQDELARSSMLAEDFKSKRPDDRVVALWRDDVSGGPIQIACENDGHGVWLKVWYRTATDVALDGRSDQLGRRWIYGKHRTLEISDIENRYGSVIGLNGTD